ncbi:MAG: DUF2961 domain-containing protein [Phycisphaerae bacterium]|nr:DUF2961 domain-containing protein [Phycisphaerae bacterium]
MSGRAFLCAVVVLAAAGAVWAEAFTYVDLIGHLTDLERLAVLPADGERCEQWSSYDRASKYDAAADRYVGWDANDDGPGIIRREGDLEVFAEIEGPAVIWRIWSAQDGPGHVKIYLDGGETPAVDLPFKAYFDLSTEPFTRPALVHKVAQGLNNYTPIPFQKSCKIVAEKNWGRYYHFTYTKYPKGTKLPTFSMKLTDAESEALDRANALLTAETPRRRGSRQRQSVTVGAGQKVQVLKLDGAQAITSLFVKPELPEKPGDVDVLRELTIAMYWDGETTPSVWAPLGDFFGTAAGENLYRSFPLGMTEAGYYSRWYMPFGNGAVIEIGNDGDQERRIEFGSRVVPLQRPIEQLGRFHAKWHRDMDLDPKRAIDWTMLKTQGRGRFCGVMLHVWNPRGSWWGEGDEKFFIDGEKFPSTFGTGSEDYFGYAWCDPTLFTNCYHNQTISMNNKGHISVNRWHVSDNVPFTTSFEGAIEKYYLNSRPTLYACTSYWYLDKQGVDHYRPVAVSERKGYWGPIYVFAVKGAIEGEKLKVLRKTGGNLNVQDMTGFGEVWSGEAQLWWTGGRPGDVVELALPVAESGRYKVKMQLTKAVDYGIVKISLDGKNAAGSPFDFFNNGVVATGELDMGTFELSKGDHVIRMEITGANARAVKGYMAGLDYVRLERQ